VLDQAKLTALAKDESCRLVLNYDIADVTLSDNERYGFLVAQFSNPTKDKIVVDSKKKECKLWFHFKEEGYADENSNDDEDYNYDSFKSKEYGHLWVIIKEVSVVKCSIASNCRNIKFAMLNISQPCVAFVGNNIKHNLYGWAFCNVLNEIVEEDTKVTKYEVNLRHKNKKLTCTQVVNVSKLVKKSKKVRIRRRRCTNGITSDCISIGSTG